MQPEHRSNKKEGVLVLIVAIMGISANLPEDIAANLGIDRQYLLIALTATVVFALFRYLKFMLFLVVTLLAVGANLPSELAFKLGVDKDILLIVLFLLIGVSFVNYLFKLLPTGIDEAPRKTSSEHGGKVLFTAVSRGDLSLVKRLLDMGIDVNTVENGSTSLIEASRLGYSDLVQLLLLSGANPDVRGPDGKNALEVALQNGFTGTANVLASTPRITREAAA
jgi:hypothetical protein